MRTSLVAILSSFALNAAIASAQLAPTPPMGWNSYDAFGDSVTEEEILANARYMKQHLLAHGWNYVVVDFRWYDPKPTGDDSRLYKDRLNAELSMDEFGRLLPAENRFPSSAGAKGFKPLSDQIHEMGLKFGIHVMRGIPRMAVKKNVTIEGTSDLVAWDASSFSTCAWCPDMFGVNASHPAGQAWYDSIFRQYASWGVDYVKVDDLSQPYSAGEVEAIRRAIDKCGRPMVFSTSPGPTPIKNAEHVARHANLWRISGDFWDDWKKLDQQFELLHQWQGKGGPGHWPDADMIPFGRIAIRSRNGGTDHRTKFTKDEQVTLMTLWAIAPSPLMLGMNLPDNDEWTNSLLTNDAVLAINQDRAGKPAFRVAKDGALEVWVKDLADGDKTAAMFNRGDKNATATLRWPDARLAGKYVARDLWKSEDLGTFESELTRPVTRHGAVLLRLKTAQ